MSLDFSAFCARFSYGAQNFKKCSYRTPEIQQGVVDKENFFIVHYSLNPVNTIPNDDDSFRFIPLKEVDRSATFGEVATFLHNMTITW